jgi:imidazolonepropionase-like amidohydrolase
VPPHTFETAQTVDNAVSILNKAGVKIAVTTLDMSFTRNIRWEAGFAVSEGLNYYEALKAITRNPAEMFGIYGNGAGMVQVGQKANFVVYSSDPLAIGGQVQLVALGNFAQCNPVPL